MESQRHPVVFRRVKVQNAAVDAVRGEFENVLRYRVVGIEEVPRTRQRVQEAVGDAPGVAAFTDAFELIVQLTPAAWNTLP